MRMAIAGILGLITASCYRLTPAAYRDAQEACLEAYSEQWDIDAERDVACVTGVRLLRKALER
jgi:hypothetical protein